MPAVPRVRAIAGVAALYAVCGAVSSVLAAFGTSLVWKWPLNATEALTPMPFALLSGALLLGTTWKTVPAVLVTCAAWLAAHSIAVRTVNIGSPYFGFCLAGLAGGLGVALADSICRPKLLAPKHLAAAALIGSAAGLPFGAWAMRSESATYLAYMGSFAIWQASVGTYLYAVCTHGRECAERRKCAEEETSAR